MSEKMATAMHSKTTPLGPLSFIVVFHWKKGDSHWKPTHFFWGEGRVYAPIQRKQIPEHEPPDPYPLMASIYVRKHPSASPF